MPRVSVSILSMDKENAVSTFYNLETAKVDYFHIDVMDGKFVEKNTLDWMLESSLTLSHISNVGLDVHLMVNDVEKVMDDYIALNPQMITFHIEAIQEEERIWNLIEEIKENGIKVGIAINPATDWKVAEKFLPYVHQVLMMTVVPGKGGQKLIPETLDKVKALKVYLEEHHLDIDIEADGGIDDKTAESVRQAGSDILVSGSYIVGSENFIESVKKIRGK